MSLDPNIPVSTGMPNAGGAVAMANAITVAVGVYRGLVGNTVANTIDGSPLLTAQLAQLASQRITDELITRHKKAVSMRLIKA